MKGYVEFTGKTLDEAIKGACEYFGVPREKLEIEIVNDAKTGIFGLVGAKKATLRARRVQLQDIGLSFGDDARGGERKGGDKKPDNRRGERNSGNQANESAQSVQSAQAGQSGRSAQSEPSGQASQSAQSSQSSHSSQSVQSTPAGQSGQPAQSGKKRGGRGQNRGDELQVRPDGALEVHKTNLPSVVDAGNDGADSGAREDSRGSGRKKSARDGAEARSERTDRADRSDRAGRQPKPKQDRKSGKDDTKEAGGRGRQQRERGRQGEDSARGDSRNKKQPRAPHADARPDKGFAPDASDDMPDFAEQLPVVPLESVDQELLRSTVMEALQRLVCPIVGEIESSFTLDDGRVRVLVSCGDNCGLLIGRDGQTLSALQYILSCIASRKLNVSVRVQIDAGDYREKQDEKLRELALSLAQKVKSTSRPQSTRPLSAYHRRIIHMTLQDDPQVQTHSKGEGGLKRVVVVPRRK